MFLMELQRQLSRRVNKLQRIVFLTIAAATFCAALIMTLHDAASRQAYPAESASPKQTEEQPVEKLGTAITKRLEPTGEERKLLARAVYSEARGEQFQGQIAVAAVILNRIEDPDFPNDAAGVIFQPLAFTAVADGQFWLEPDREAYQAVDEALRGDDPSLGALYYYNPVTASSAWIFGRPTITRIGRHVFAG